MKNWADYADHHLSNHYVVYHQIYISNVPI